MNITEERRILFERDYPFAVMFFFKSDVNRPIVLKYPGFDEFETMYSKPVDMLPGYYMDNLGRKRIMLIKKDDILRVVPDYFVS